MKQGISTEFGLFYCWGFSDLTPAWIIRLAGPCSAADVPRDWNSLKLMGAVLKASEVWISRLRDSGSNRHIVFGFFPFSFGLP